jgi:hypothetical protein
MDTVTDDSWRARARDRVRPMKARALAELLMRTPDAYVRSTPLSRIARCSRPAPLMSRLQWRRG